MKKNILKPANKALYIVMALMLFAGVVKAQESKKIRDADSIAVTKLSTETGLTKVKATQILGIMRYRSADRARISADNSMDKTWQRTQLMEILMQRRRKLDSLLTGNEVMQLLQRQEPAKKRQRDADSLILLQQQQKMIEAGGQLVKQE